MADKVTRNGVAIGIIALAAFEWATQFVLDVMIQTKPRDAAANAMAWVDLVRNWSSYWAAATLLVIAAVIVEWPWIRSVLVKNNDSAPDSPITKLKVTIGDPDLHHDQRAYYLQGKVTNPGPDTVRGIKAKLVNFQDFGTTVKKDFDLAWSHTRPQSIDLRPGESEIFDIGVLAAGGWPPMLEFLLFLGDKRITQKYRYRGKYPIEIHVLADGIREPIVRKLDVTVAEGKDGNSLVVEQTAPDSVACNQSLKANNTDALAKTAIRAAIIIGLLSLPFVIWRQRPARPVDHNEEIVHGLSELLIRAQVIQRQCQGVHLAALKPGETTRTQYAKWYVDVNQAFRTYGLDFQAYHAELENVPPDCTPDPTCISKEDCQVFCEVTSRQVNLSKMIDRFMAQGTRNSR